jgi:hypothetical protein
MTEIRSELSTKVGIFVQCWQEALDGLRHPLLLVPLLPLLVAEAGWLAMLATFPRPPLDLLFVPAWRAAGGEVALHYPDAYAMLPRVAGWGAPLLVWLAGVPGLAVVVASLPAVFRGERATLSAERGGATRWPTAWLATLPALVIGVVALVAADMTQGPARRTVDVLARDLFGIAFLGVALALRATLAYALPGVVLGRLSAGAAIARSASLSVRYLGVSAGFVVGEALFAFPLRIAPEVVLGLFDRLPPESAFVITGIGLVGAALGAWFFAATTTRLYLHRHGVRA